MTNKHLPLLCAPLSALPTCELAYLQMLGKLGYQIETCALPTEDRLALWRRFRGVNELYYECDYGNALAVYNGIISDWRTLLLG